MRLALVILAAALLVTACIIFRPQVSRAEGQFYANGPLPPVTIPFDNPQTDAKIRLGAQLYFDGRLSSDGTISCASCHRPDKAWADTEPVSEGVAHQKGARNSPSIINAAYIIPQFWDGRALHLEKQAVGPVQNPIEMDLTVEEIEFRLNHIPGYVTQFQEVFGSRATIDLLAKAIASFERTVISGDSPYDKYIRGDRSAMSKAAARGMHIFNGKGHCTACHSGPAFSDSHFHNLGVGYERGRFKDVGRYAATKDSRDMGAFLTQRLRNIAQTPPYMHDGSERTMEGVINLYARGGIPNPNLDPAMVPLNLTDDEKRDLVEFLKALSGPYPIVEPPPLPNPELTAQELRKMMQGGAE